jgi:hypothetical protein
MAQKMGGVILILAISLIFNSCQKESFLKDEPANISEAITDVSHNGLSSKNGRIIFNDSTVFQKHINWIIENQDNPEIIKTLNKNLGIISLNSVFQKGMEIEDETKFEAYRQKHSIAFIIEVSENEKLIEQTCPTVISYLANENGVFQIGNTVSKVTANQIYTEVFSSEVQVTELSDKSKEELTSKLKGAGVTISTEYVKTKYRGSKHKYRLVAKVRLYSYSNGWNIFEGITYTQRKRCGVWTYSDLAGDVTVSWDNTLCYKDGNNNTQYVDNNGSKSNPKYRVTATVFSYNIHLHTDLLI